MTKGSYDFQQQCKTATSLVKTNQKDAVYVRGAFKRYGTKRNPIVVLDGLDMTVPQGCIYGLLGASGCGKTTLLNCIVGRKRLNSGDIWVLGGKPGCKGSGVPGPRIGYMPQNIGLLESFTISETFKFFGWICNMTSKEVEAKVEFFINLLSLPDANCIVENLSGGQQRRLSLAVALLHEPELLILDEPTVGVDPLLRIKIWNHLMEITEKSNVTVILTTHYIEETKQAHLIGLMRGGYLLAEESPERLLSQYNAHNLEDVFLKLSVMQNITKGRKSSILETICKSIDLPAFSNEIINDDITDIESQKKSELVCGKETSKIVTISKHEEKSYESEYEMQNTDNFKNYLPVIKSTHINALIWKNFLWMWRNLPMMAFVIGLPLGQMLLFCLAVGRDPRNLTFSVVNKEMISNECDIPSCNTTTLSCNYFEYLTNHFSMYFDFYTNEEEAIAVVKKGKSWAFLMVHHNFSSALRNRYDLGPLHTDIEDIFASSISVHQDPSSPIVDNYIRANLLKGFIDFIKPQLLSCGLNPRLGDIPIRMKSIYGTDQLQFMDFAAPGVLLTIVFFMAVALTSATVLQENKEGTLERSLINGINSIELLLSQSISTFAVIFCQTLLLISVSFNLFDINQEGSWFLLTVLSLLSGIFGISYGFIVTCICDTERSATFLALGSFFPILNLCGFCWPIESMNKYLKFFAKWLPITQSTQSLRCIMAKGWTITSPEVYIGFIAMIVWTLLFIVISMLVLNKKEKSENY